MQLLSDSTPAEKHKQADAYAAPPGLREIIVYLDKYSKEKEKKTHVLFYNHSDCLPGGQMETV